MLYVGLIMKDGREGGWKEYQRHPGVEKDEEDVFDFYFYNVPEAPARAVLFNRSIGGRALAMKPFETTPETWEVGTTKIEWHIHFPTQDTPISDRLAAS